MVQLSQLLSFAVVGVTAVLASPQRVYLYSEPYYHGKYVHIPSDGTCYNLDRIQPNLAGRVSSAVITTGVECAIYSGWNCRGSSVVSDEDIEDLADAGYGLEHATRSIVCSV